MALETVTKEELGRRLSTIRAYLRLDLKDVQSGTAKLGQVVPMSTLSGYENGTRWPPITKLQVLCTFYGVDMSALLGSGSDWLARAFSGESSTARESSVVDWPMAESVDAASDKRALAERRDLSRWDAVA